MEATTVIIGRIIGMLACFLVGLVIAKYGFEIYKQNSVQDSNSQHFSWGDLTIYSKGSGAVIMSTATIWAVVGYFVSPSLTSSEYGPIVGQNTEKETILNIKPVTSSISQPLNTEESHLLLLSGFRQGLIDNPSAREISINGMLGVINLWSTNYSVDDVGNTVMTADADGDWGKVTISYQPHVDGRGVVFEPTELIQQVKPISEMLNNIDVRSGKELAERMAEAVLSERDEMGRISYGVPSWSKIEAETIKAHQVKKTSSESNKDNEEDSRIGVGIN